MQAGHDCESASAATRRAQKETTMQPDWFVYQSEDQASDLHVVRKAQCKRAKKAALVAIERGIAQLLINSAVDYRTRQARISAGQKYVVTRKAILFGWTNIN